MQNRYPMLSKADAAWLSETLARNTARFGGWVMEAAGQQQTGTEGAQGTQGATGTASGAEGQQGATAAGKATKTAASSASGDDGKGGKDAVLADLAKERDKRQELEKQIETLKSSAVNREELAKALGITPEETSDTDKLADQIRTLNEQFSTAQRKATLLEVAAEPGEDAEGNKLPAIPKEYHHLLTATETEALKEQAKSIAALIAAKAAGEGTPGFVAGNGQGQGDGKTPALGQQIAAAEKELANAAAGSSAQKDARRKVMALKAQQLEANATRQQQISN